VRPGRKSNKRVKTLAAEKKRLAEEHAGTKPWTRWGPYLSERQWGTVREDYSPGGTAWEYFPHDHARSRAYRWGEDGLAGFSDRQQHLCFAVALWNGRDPILKERLFGLTNNEGNHGEDVKEIYYYLDATPTNSYLKMLYKYPQQEFPYARLAEESRRRGKDQPEFELLDTGIFNDDRYFDVFVEYAKADPDDIAIRITAHNRGPEEALLHLLPQLWFRNVWSWEAGVAKPALSVGQGDSIVAEHSDLGRHAWHWDSASITMQPAPGVATAGKKGGRARSRSSPANGIAVPPEILFCDNETNGRRLFNRPDAQGFFKDAFHDFVVAGNTGAVNPERIGTKSGLLYRLAIPPGGSAVVRLRLTAIPAGANGDTPAKRGAFAGFDAVFNDRVSEADDFYAGLQTGIDDPDARSIQRQALAGMIWNKQYFHYNVARWLDGDPAQPPPPPERRQGRNCDWKHLYNASVMSMPDKWEYPWYASWDLAFHCIPLCLLDSEFAKSQLVLLTREWYMHPNGQIPAYEWAFSDVNPPVHAWAAWRVFQIDRKQRRETNPHDPGDLFFLERVYHKLLINFTWWVNRKDALGRNIFQGGFLGLDNIGVFDRSAPLPTGGFINQADGTSWMAMYCLNLLRIALELARHNHAYEDIATKFFEHFLGIAAAINGVGGDTLGLWDNQDEFYYDSLHLPDGRTEPLKVRSMVGLIPLCAVETLEPGTLRQLPGFAERLEWYLTNRPDLAGLVSRWQERGSGERRLLSLLRGHRIKCLLRRMLDETEFLSPYGVRALSKFHEREPFRLRSNGITLEVPYWPAESRSGLFGGNSNWRGPVWMPMNYLLIESLQKFHHYYGDDFKVECPTGSGNFVTLLEVACELSRRITRLFLRGSDNHRPIFGENEKLQVDPHFRDHVLFYEYFHGDNGSGLGAEHQTGWTGLVAKLLQPRNDNKKAALPERRPHEHRAAEADGL
jgi:hypothetical protein